MKLSQVPNKTTGNGIKIFGYLCFIVSCYLIFLRFEVALAQQPEPQPLAGFTVESVIPDNQLDKNQTYFYLGVQPSNQQIIQVKIRSLQKEPVTVALSIHDAVNGTEGQIDYTQTSPKLDSSLTNSITQIVHLQNKEATVTVKNFEE
ncbi:WxL protein peptidoglycan domain-containing protein, partial [Enterococcus gallinarum]